MIMNNVITPHPYTYNLPYSTHASFLPYLSLLSFTRHLFDFLFRQSLESSVAKNITSGFFIAVQLHSSIWVLLQPMISSTVVPTMSNLVMLAAVPAKQTSRKSISRNHIWYFWIDNCKISSLKVRAWFSLQEIPRADVDYYRNLTMVHHDFTLTLPGNCFWSHRPHDPRHAV